MVASTTAVLRQRYLDREISPVTAIEEALTGIHVSEPSLHAYLHLAKRHALEDARRAARFLAGGDTPSLCGIPVAIKDNVEVAGMPMTAGSRVLSRTPPPVLDAWIVRRLRAAGAVVLGKANMLEFATGHVHPGIVPCRNPLDLQRSPGGSSTGSAATVASGHALVGIGTDTGGSVRIPASYCGVVGLKPSRAGLPLGGIVPLAPTLDALGILTPTVEDARIVLSVLRTGELPASRPGGSPLPSGAQVAGLLVGVALADLEAPLEPGVRAAVEDAAGVLEHLGARAIEIRLPGIARMQEAWATILNYEAAEVHRAWLRDRATGYSPGLFAQLEAGAMISRETYLGARALQEQCLARQDDLFGGSDVLLLPTTATTALRFQDWEKRDLGAYVRRTFLWNCTDSPALSLPFGHGASGLPSAVQIVCRRGADDLLLQVAATLEAARAAAVTRGHGRPQQARSPAAVSESPSRP